MLVGREFELERLGEVLGEAERGHGRVVLVTGEPGIGKSRLAEETSRLAERAGRRAVWGHAWEAGSAPPFWPWIQVLRALERDDGLLRESGPAGGGDRLEVFDAFVRQLAAAATSGPMVILLEDLHVADRATLLLLGFAARQVRGLPLLLLGTYRDAEVRLVPERAAILARVARDAEVLELRPLGRADVGRLVRDAIPVAADDSLIDMVHRTTDGNPLFLDEVLRLLETRREHSDAIPIPEGVRAAIREHVGRLDPASRAVLEAASVLGRDIAVPVLAGALGVTPAAVAERLTLPARAGLVAERGPAELRFSHVLVRDTLYDDLDRERRAELHRRTAETLAALRGDEPVAPLADIARHFAAAGPACVGRAIEYARRAARAAREQLAPEEAVPPLERALTLVDDARTRGDLLVELAEAYIAAGDDEAGRRTCRHAAALARAAGDGERLARAALAFGLLFTFGAVDREMVAVLEEALAAIGPAESALRARLLARLAGALQPAEDPTVPIARAREAIAVARRLADEPTLRAVLLAAGSALQDIADPRERLPLNRELLELARARGDRALVLRAHARLAFDRLEGGDPAAADAEMRAYQREAEPFRQPRHHFFPAMWWALRALMSGDFDEHARRVEEARRVAGDDPNASRCLGCHAFLAARLRGDRQAAAGLASGARWFLDCIPASVAFVHALLHADRGDLDAARGALARVPAEAHAASVPTIMRGLLAEAVAAAGDAALAQLVHQALKGFSHRLGAWSMTAMVCDGPVTRHLALVAATAGCWDEAEAWWADALAAARAHGMRPIVAHILLERAEALERRGEHAAAAPLRAEARGLADAMGLPLLAARAGEPAATPASVELVLEGDTWSIRGAGESCRLRDTRGLQLLARLVAEPGREIPALELATGGTCVDGGDAGELLDETARRGYRERLRALDAELEQARAWNDPARASRARAEADTLAQELARAVGLGGRARRVGSAGERARVNVQRRLADAIRRIQEECPALGRHLGATVRTGRFCWYDPTWRKHPGPS